MPTSPEINKNYLSSILNKDVINISKLNSGNDSNVYRIDTVGEKSLILKLPLNESRLSLAKYTFEAEAYRLLDDKNLKTPKLIYTDDKCMILDFIEGEMMDDQVNLYLEHQLFIDFAADLKKVHNTVLDGFGYFDFDHYLKTGKFRGKNQSWVDFLNSVWIGNSYLLKSALESDVFDSIYNYWKENVDKTELMTGRLLHGDFSMAHIFVKNGKYTGIIDLGDAFIGDPLVDLAYFKLKEINKSYGDQVFERLVNNYFDSEDVLDSIRSLKLNIYMIFWVMERVNTVNDRNIASKFIKKLRVVDDRL